MKAFRPAFALLPLLAACLPAAFSGEAAINIHVASRAYIVSVAPVDEDSKQAESSILYQRGAGGGEWIALGPCRKDTSAAGAVRFTREVEVKEDGVYLYTSRPVVGGRVEEPPGPGAPPQARVVVDTLPPTAEITEPLEGAEAVPGRPLKLAWTCADENLAPRPASLSYSTDGGKSWLPIARELPQQGETAWSVPDDLAGPVVVRLAAVDLAGNVGRDLRRLEMTPPAPPATTEPAAAGPAKPAAQPEKTAEEPKTAETPAKAEKSRDSNRSWLYYLMAVNLMRQDKPADALQYYWLTVKEDPDFIDAWADIGLAYIDLGAYRTAREIVEQTRDKAPERIDLMHLLGETYHAEGMALLASANSSEDRLEAKGLIDRAVEWYGRALDRAAGEWRLAEQAASFYRLGEVCYYVNMDRDGARAYWKKILELHSPTPNRDLVLWTPKDERAKAEKRQQRYTYQRVSLETWQNWARGYLEQLDERERRGILDLTPAEKIAAVPAPRPLGYGPNDMNPGRDDGRSLFSLPAQLGGPADVEACSGSAPAAPAPAGGAARTAPLAARSPAAEQYSFYAPKGGAGGAGQSRAAPAKRGGGSLFSGGPDQPPPPNPDPYAFPSRSRGGAAWNGAGPYGDSPAGGW